jgi:hypothetical protein
MFILPPASATFRKITLLLIALNAVLFNLYNYTYGLKVASHSPDSFYFILPGSYFLSWQFIYITFIVYGIIQLLPSQRNYSIYDQLSLPLILLNILIIFWMVLDAGNNSTAPALAVLMLMFILAFILFIKAHNAVVIKDYNLWLQFPFCFLSACLLLQLAGDFLSWVNTAGFNFRVGHGIITLCVVLFMALLGFVVNIRTHSLVFPFVITCGFYSLWLSYRHHSAQIADLTLTCLIILAIISVSSGIFKRSVLVTKSKV